MRTQVTYGDAAVAIPRPKAAKRNRSSDPFRRDPLACALMDAVAPLLVEDNLEDWEFAPGLHEIDAYRALLPICRDFTVVDAARAYLSIHPTTKAMHRQGTERDRDARCEARNILEAFIAVGRPSSPNDVLALAEHLTLFDDYEEYEPVMIECLRQSAALTLADGIRDWRRNDFSAGETFGSAGDGTDRDGWCYRAAMKSKRMEWWFGLAVDRLVSMTS